MKHRILLSALLLSLSAPAWALPGMEITSAKNTLTSRKPTPTGQEFKHRRVSDLPTFDKLGVGNYFSQYRLDGQKLMIWMYVESAPPAVDEVVLFVTPASAKDDSFARALKLVDLVYGESNSASQVVNDLKNAQSKEHKNDQKVTMLTFEEKSLLPKGYDGYRYYIGDLYGYKIGLHKGGFEVGIYRKDVLMAQIKDVKKRLYPDPLPPGPTPPPLPPLPTPHPPLRW
ncbi:hypothetical protein COW36_16090 [bacterium (Candidatus Blackallbacteria) CG17_big_fil_post_rev_8_21_14_2_50_48_46]|uniref:Uncharacterized protein n=1 Tax=bacterium (Candidatus Blackallbacteria) CG17_big_fil_post_rev_8_21_14_2_50_48_46 TaxID=2014261 RepID=A0A2M7G1V0_9BACT|nr:MAG: hypothetical protein COW64_08575 [bacterium (Candidatus Blackallbacteria) CG18_big_fil_WC_8_21_14_2_50_49_26]PIW15723.1 MAG: hypothetical protein COW36_16090 [bacterium (Candidatus Blackallbacteria) CG17_big_fil_post_rev_8_21_14_2_50_48_46]PIW49225.1 MAG: hypothetical protein COW20_06600 [bacterium (Candidatus Blackallbacteria) CG13_big_fil_rev_8_21_14_2_50_49_14]